MSNKTISPATFLKSFKVNDADKFNNLDYISSLDKDEVISKLLLAVFSLQNDVQQLNKKIGEYENLNKVLETDDLTPDTFILDEQPTKVTKITKYESDESTPAGFTPMFSTPALSESEIVERPSKRQMVAKPWPEITLNQLASRFKIPKESLVHTHKDRKKDYFKALKPNVVHEPEPTPPPASKPTSRLASRRNRTRTAESSTSPETSVVSETTTLSAPTSRSSRNSTKRQYETEKENTPIKSTTKQIEDKTMKRFLKYSLTKDGLFKCTTCTPIGSLYSNYPALYQHKRNVHPDEFNSIAHPKSENDLLHVSSDNINTRAGRSNDYHHISNKNNHQEGTYQPRKIGSTGPINIRMADMYVKLNEKDYRCKFCKTPFTSYHGVYFHLKNVHTDPKTGVFVENKVKLSERKKFRRLQQLKASQAVLASELQEHVTKSADTSDQQIDNETEEEIVVEEDDDDEDMDDSEETETQENLEEEYPGSSSGSTTSNQQEITNNGTMLEDSEVKVIEVEDDQSSSIAEESEEDQKPEQSIAEEQEKDDQQLKQEATTTAVIENGTAKLEPSVISTSTAPCSSTPPSEVSHSEIAAQLSVVPVPVEVKVKQEQL